MFLMGYLWIKVERPQVNWEKYLGKDWNPTYEGASTYVSNHTSYIDIFFYLQWDIPCYLSKQGVQKYPLIGKIAEGI